MHKTKLLLLLFLIPYFSTEIILAQEISKQEIPKLTIEQMHEDYNFLSKIIFETFPMTEPLKRETDYDVLKIIKNYESCIDTISNNYSFVNCLIAPMLQSCIEPHIKLVSPEIFYLLKDAKKEISDTCLSSIERIQIKNYLNAISKYVDSSFFHRSREMMNLYNPSKNSATFFTKLNGFYVNYIDGNYYTTSDFRYKGKKFKLGMKILTINGLTPDEIVNKYTLFEKDGMRWDFENKKFYNNNFYNIKELDLPEINFEFESAFGKKFLINLKDKTFKALGTGYLLQYSKVNYFKKQQLLYIYLTYMGSQAKINKKVIKKANNKTIKNIIIDIRNNGGGNDYVWIDLLKILIDTTLITPNSMVAHNTEIIKNYYSISDSEKIKLPIFSEDDYIKMNHESDTINPSAKSLGFKGIIYLLQNMYSYSSAMAFSEYALLNPRILSIGNNTGLMGGLGASPLFFMLPNSKLIFCMVVTMPANILQKPSDIFNHVEINLHLTPKDYQIIRTKGWRNSKHYLKKHDPYFLKAIEQHTKDDNKLH